MTTEELLAEIARGRTFAERLPLYNAAMQVGLLTVRDIHQAFKTHEVEKPVAKKAPAKRTAKKATPNIA